MKIKISIAIFVLVIACGFTIFLVVRPSESYLPEVEDDYVAQPPPQRSPSPVSEPFVMPEAVPVPAPLEIPPFEPYEGNLFPSISLTAAYDPFTMHRNTWHSGHMTLVGHDHEFENADVRIRGRGNSSWIFGAEKRPLRIRFNEPTYFFGPVPAYDWVLIANHFDLTLMRTYLAFYLAGLLDGMDWTASANFAHLYINGAYVGLFQISDERDIIPGRIQLVSDPDPQLSEFLFELDNSAVNSGEEGVTYFVVNEMPYDIRYPRGAALSTYHVAYLQNWVEEMTVLLQRGNFDEISQAVDLDSFVDFYIVQEFFKNIDVGFNSVFMQARGVGNARRLYFGPVWDFDRSVGNMLFWGSYEHLHAAVRNQFMRYLLQVPEVFDMVAERWAEIVDDPIVQMLARIDELLEYEQDFERNFYAFPVWENRPDWMDRFIPIHLQEIDTWRGQVEYMQEWFAGRVWWMSELFIGRGELAEWWIRHLGDV